MIAATNQVGFCIERHALPAGWQAIPHAPFPTRDEALQHLRDMPKAPGVEHRVYASLRPQ